MITYASVWSSNIDAWRARVTNQVGTAMLDLVPADRYDEYPSRPSAVNADGPSRRRVIGIVERCGRCNRRQWTSARRVIAGVLALVAGTALHLQAQIQNSPLTFDVAFSMALRRNADSEGLRRQLAIWDAQHASDVAGPDVYAHADADCPPTCTNVARSVDICRNAVRDAIPPIGDSFAARDIVAFAQIVRRNLRQAFDDLALSDEELQEIQGLVDFASQLRTMDSSDAEPTGHPRLDPLRLEIALSRARLELIRAQSRRRTAQAAFNAVLNRASDVRTTIVGQLSDPVPLPELEQAIRLSKAMDVELGQLRHGIEVQRRVRGVSGRLSGLSGGPVRGRRAEKAEASGDQRPGNAALDAQVVRLEMAAAARERALEACVREGFARIERRRQGAAHLKDALTPAVDAVTRIEDRYRAGRPDVMDLLATERARVDLRREAIHVLYDLRLSEADVEECLPALGVKA